MKEDIENGRKNYKNIPSVAEIENMNLGKLIHQEGPSPPSMKIFYLVTTILEKQLDTKQFIVNPIQ